MKTAKKSKNTELTVKFHYTETKEPIEKILREVVVRFIKGESDKLCQRS